MILRLALLALAALSLLAGLCAGLWRLGWTLPHGSSLAALHGPLLVSGLFGTLISLERAVALRLAWPYAAPMLSALGTVALLTGGPIQIGAGLYVAASGTLTVASLHIVRLQPAVFTGALLAGAGAWLAGNLLWLSGRMVPEVAGWWLAFLILTIAGERLELSRLIPGKRGGTIWFLLAACLLLFGAQSSLMSEWGAALYGAGLLVLTGWLQQHDIAFRNISRPDQPRFMAGCMLAGYAWLCVAGLVLLGLPTARVAFGYDIILHAILIGFVFSMVFGHALIILPAVIRVRVPYTRALYVPLVLLHVSVALRIGSGFAEWEAGRRASGAVTILAILAFAACIGVASWLVRRRTTGEPVTPV